MGRSRFALRDCTKLLCSGRRYLIGEVGPTGFGVWENNGVLPIATYPATLQGWDQVVDHFLMLGDRPLPFALQQHQRRRIARRAG